MLFSNSNFLFYFQSTIILPVVFGHGMLIDPVNRGSAWRLGFNTPINYNDNENYCGGFNVRFIYLFIYLIINYYYNFFLLGSV